jgi:hypothetical protein
MGFLKVERVSRPPGGFRGPDVEAVLGSRQDYRPQGSEINQDWTAAPHPTNSRTIEDNRSTLPSSVSGQRLSAVLWGS